MVSDMVILYAGAKALKDSINIELMKSKEIELSKGEKDEITGDNNRRFIHFTSKKNAQSILKSGFLVPSSGYIKNHFTNEINDKGKKEQANLVYMFDSKYLDIQAYIDNLPKKYSPNNGVYEFYAVSYKPNEYEVNNFKRRLQDGAITHNGRLDIDGTDTRIVKYVLGLDEKGQYNFSEVPFDYEYTPSEELLQKIKESKKDNVISYSLKMYKSEIKKSKLALKRYRGLKDEYKRKISEKKDFAKANKQFIEEEKDNNYIFEENGKTLVVKKLGYEIVDGKKLLKIAIIGNEYDQKNKSFDDVVKTCYMDDFYDINNIPKEDATKYIFNNYYEMLNKGENETKYIGIPLKDMETGELENQYDEKFKEHYDKKIQAKKYADYNQDMINSKKMFGRIKSFFKRVLGKKEEVKMLEESSTKKDEREFANKFGYASYKAMNSGENVETISVESDLRSELNNYVNTEKQIYEKNGNNQKIPSRNYIDNNVR